MAVFPRTVGVVGGGTAGYFAALALKRRFPDLSVTQIESSSIPIIGVGEATTTLMPAFLHRTLGLDIVEMFRAVAPTFKLGIQFAWGPDERGFSYPFGDIAPVDALRYDGDLATQSVLAHFMAADRGPVVRAPDGSLLSLLPSLKFAYHLENRAFVAFLAAAARRAAIELVDATIEGVALGDGGVASLRTTDGRTLTFDLYVDATGFRSLLLGDAAKVPFESYASSLFCDRAVVAPVAQTDIVQPYTFAETMNAGWCWRTPVDGEDHRGYVFSSAFLSDDEALREMQAKNPTMRRSSIVKFSSGRRRDFWRGNVVGIGNSYGFVEPLESTALHMVILQISCVVEALAAQRADGGGSADGQKRVERANRAIGDHWDYLRWFLAIHYRFNGRLDTPLWRAARAEADVSGIEERLARYRREGPWMPTREAAGAAIDPTFNEATLMLLLLGQRALGSEHVTREPAPAAWRTRTEREAAVASRALSHRDTLTALQSAPEMLRAFVQSERSWIHKEEAMAAAFVRSFMA